MNDFQQNLHSVQSQIAQSATAVQRHPSSIQLLAVSKGQSKDALADAIHTGQRTFGENYVQEGLEKIRYWATFEDPKPLQWHFIGPLQRNKIRLIATHFDWVQTIASLAQAQQLNQHRAATQHPPLQVLIQLNLRDPTVGWGVLPEALMPLVAAVHPLPYLCLRGLMAMPAPTADRQQTAANFHQAQALFQALQAVYPQFDTLSMGMSNDLSEAIAAGSTLVRVGTALFGAR